MVGGGVITNREIQGCYVVSATLLPAVFSACKTEELQKVYALGILVQQDMQTSTSMYERRRGICQGC